MSVLHGSGMRLNECLRLRIKDIDLNHKQITIRQSKGFKDRVTVLPKALEVSLKEQIKNVQIIYNYDNANI